MIIFFHNGLVDSNWSTVHLFFNFLRHSLSWKGCDIPRIGRITLKCYFDSYFSIEFTISFTVVLSKGMFKGNELCFFSYFLIHYWWDIPFRKSCIKFQSGSWSTLTENLTYKYFGHGSWVNPDGDILLIGGSGSLSTTEIVYQDGTSFRSFDLKYDIK